MNELCHTYGWVIFHPNVCNCIFFHKTQGVKFSRCANAMSHTEQWLFCKSTSSFKTYRDYVFCVLFETLQNTPQVMCVLLKSQVATKVNSEPLDVHSLAHIWMSRIRMSHDSHTIHVTHMNGSCHICEWGMSRIWLLAAAQLSTAACYIFHVAVCCSVL